MFGYIRTRTGELLVREQEAYTAAYCGLCRSEGKCTGTCSRLFLSYDVTFLTLLRSLLTGEEPVSEYHRCVRHPFRKRKLWVFPLASREMACASAVLNAYRVRDDLHDEKGWKRFRAMLAFPLVVPGERKARKRYPDLCRTISDGMRALSELEAQVLPSVDVYAEAFGRPIGELLAAELDGQKATVARALGMHFGKWLYLIDAADDFAEDIKRHRFNPLAPCNDEPTLTDQTRQMLEIALTEELMAAEAAMDLLDAIPAGDSRVGIVRNLIRFGMPDVCRNVLYPKPKKTQKEKRS